MVSAIITTYKRPPEIVERAAKSVLNQSYNEIELLIVDDSPDTYELRNAVRDKALSLEGNVRYIQHEKNMGACAARNTGLSIAKGKYVAFLDDDDEWLPEKIEKQVELIEKKEEIALVYCGRYSHYVKEEKTVVQKTRLKKGFVFDSLILENFIGSASFPLIRKDVIDSLGGFDINMPAAQDFEMWLRIAQNYEIDYIEEPLVRYYVHEGEQITKNSKKKVEALDRIHNLHKEYLEANPKAFCLRLLFEAYVCAEVDLKKARKLFWQALKLYKIPTINTLKTFKWVYIMPIFNRK